MPIKLEDALYGTAADEMPPHPDTIALSTAISLKRIADALEVQAATALHLNNPLMLGPLASSLSPQAKTISPMEDRLRQASDAIGARLSGKAPAEGPMRDLLGSDLDAGKISMMLLWVKTGLTPWVDQSHG